MVKVQGNVDAMGVLCKTDVRDDVGMSIVHIWICVYNTRFDLSHINFRKIAQYIDLLELVKATPMKKGQW